MIKIFNYSQKVVPNIKILNEDFGKNVLLK